jgi:hypothetical protein
MIKFKISEKTKQNKTKQKKIILLKKKKKIKIIK